MSCSLFTFATQFSASFHFISSGRILLFVNAGQALGCAHFCSFHYQNIRCLWPTQCSALGPFPDSICRWPLAFAISGLLAPMSLWLPPCLYMVVAPCAPGPRCSHNSCCVWLLLYAHQGRVAATQTVEFTWWMVLTAMTRTVYLSGWMSQ